MDGLTFLERPAPKKTPPIYVLAGDEDFIKRRALVVIRQQVLGDDEGFGLSAYPGEKSDWAVIHDELETLPFLGGRRLVVVENADPFVTKFRASLEKYVDQPSGTGVLVLEVKTWPSTTRLAKRIDTNATIHCKAPAAYKLPEWCVRHAAECHQKQLALLAGKLLVDLVGPEMGLLDQELAKLATYVGSSSKIDAGDVDKLVGHSSSESIWKIFDAIGAGQTGEALTILDRLFTQGEDAMRILGAFSMQLRRLAQAARLARNGAPIPVAIQEVGIPPFAQRGCEQQLRHLGRDRGGRLFDWLLECDLGMKGSSQLPPRTLLERLIVRLARK